MAYTLFAEVYRRYPEHCLSFSDNPEMFTVSLLSIPNSLIEAYNAVFYTYKARKFFLRLIPFLAELSKSITEFYHRVHLNSTIILNVLVIHMVEHLIYKLY